MNRNIRLKNLVKSVWRFPYCRLLRRKLKNHEFSLITPNCLGGVLCHDLSEQFRSPTVNLTIPEYLKFVMNLEHYLAVPITAAGKNSNGHPMGRIDDILVFGVHYSSEEELIESWEKRKMRVRLDRVFLMATNEYIRTEKERELFSCLPYPKVLYTSRQEDLYPFECYCPGFEKEGQVGDLLRYTGLFGIRKFEKYFDCVAWLNQEGGGVSCQN